MFLEMSGQKGAMSLDIPGADEVTRQWYYIWHEIFPGVTPPRCISAVPYSFDMKLAWATGSIANFCNSPDFHSIISAGFEQQTGNSVVILPATIDRIRSGILERLPAFLEDQGQHQPVCALGPSWSFDPSDAGDAFLPNVNGHGDQQQQELVPSATSGPTSVFEPSGDSNGFMLQSPGVNHGNQQLPGG